MPVDRNRLENEAAGPLDNFASGSTSPQCFNRYNSGNPDISGRLGRGGVSDISCLLRQHESEAPIRAPKPASETGTLVEMPDMNVASVRFIGPYKGIGRAVGHLCRWASSLGLLTEDAFLFSAMYDIPGLTPAEDLRSDACLCVKPGCPVSPPVYLQHIHCAGLYLCRHFEFHDPREFPRHWTECIRGLRGWGYHPDDRPMLEVYHGEPRMLDGIFKVDICLPVKDES